MGRELFLVSCVKTKRDVPLAAKDLYVSDWFRKARAYVEKTGRLRWISSAEYGLVHPNEEIGPYEKTLNTMPVACRRTPRMGKGGARRYWIVPRWLRRDHFPCGQTVS